MKTSLPYRFIFFLSIIVLTSDNLKAQSISVSFTTSQYYGGYNVTCHAAWDGYAKISSISGGTPPYSYMWSTGDTTDSIGGKSAGIYTVFITDSTNTTIAAHARLFAPNAMNVSLSSTDHNGYEISTNGGDDGNINSTVNGGTGSYYWIWSNSASTQNIDNLSAGTYSVTVTDDNGCSTTAYKTLTEPDTLKISSIVKSQYGGGYNINCTDSSKGTIALTITGGASPYEYQWSNWATTQNLSGLTAGTYHVTVTDANEAETEANIIITAPADLSALETFKNQPPCSNGRVGFFGPAGGVPPYTYHLSGTSTGTGSLGANDTLRFSNLLGSKHYSCYYTDANGCRSDSSVIDTSFTAPETVSLDLVLTPHNVLCHGGSSGSINLTVIGGACPPYSYSWSNGATTEDISNIPAGHYEITAVDASNDTVTGEADITEPNYAISIDFSPSIYPNETSCSGVTIDSTTVFYGIGGYGAHDGSIEATVSGGTPSYHYHWSNNASTQNIQYLGAGSYNLTVTDNNGCTASSGITLTQPDPLVITEIIKSQYGSSNISCPVTMYSNYESEYYDSGEYSSASMDGSLEIHVEGGIAPYNFSIMNGESEQNETDPSFKIFEGLAAGIYQIEISDGCHSLSIDSSSVLIAPDTMKAPLTISTYPVEYSGNMIDFNVSCYFCKDGNAKVTLSGGTLPYSYEWTRTWGPSETIGGNTDTLQDIGKSRYPGFQNYNYFCIVTDANGCSTEDYFKLSEPPGAAPLRVSLQPYVYTGGYNASCYGINDAKIIATVTGGIGPYTYNWSPGGETTKDVTGLNHWGGQHLTVYDSNGGEVVSTEQPWTWDFNWPDVLESNFTESSSNGYGIAIHGDSTGYYTTDMTGGIPPYSYSWSNGATTASITGLPAGSYSVIITDRNGCTLSLDLVQTEPEALEITSITLPDYHGYNITCHGGDTTVAFTVTGGVEPYHYQWSKGEVLWTASSLPHLTAGTYSISVIDLNNAQGDTQIVITEPPPLNISFTPSYYANGYNLSAVGATDGTILADVTGGYGTYTYEWKSAINESVIGTSDNMDTLAAGLYELSVTDGNECIANKSRWLFQPSYGGGWDLKGNLATDADSNYLGTKDSVDLVIKTNGNEKMRIAADGSVKITSLEASGSDSSRSANGGNSIVYVDGGGVLRVDGGIGNDPGNGPGPCMAPRTWLKGYDMIRDVVLCGNERVGIGTSAPKGKLEVVDPTGLNTLEILSSGGIPNRRGISLGLDGNGQAFGDFNFWIHEWQNTNASSAFNFKESHTNSTLMTIRWDGKVGISTNAPTEKLDVHGNIRLDRNTLLLKDDSYHGLAYDGLPSASTIDGPVLYGYGGGALGSKQPTEQIALKWDNNGRVSIGGGNTWAGSATIPECKLAVYGKIVAEEVFVRASPWPDYVFKSDYTLKSIYELKDFIKKHHHLPNMPSASEIESSRMGVSAMASKQMEKIEELTLYLIQLNEKIDALQKENAEIKSKLNNK